MEPVVNIGILFRCTADEVSLKEVITPGSETLQTMGDELVCEITDVALACKLHVSVDMCLAFGGLGRKEKIPTKQIIQQLVPRVCDTTSNDVVLALDKILHNDVLLLLARRFPDSVSLGEPKIGLIIMLNLLFSTLLV